MSGRPTIRTDEIVQEVLDDIAAGVPLAEICRRGHMPTRTTWYEWAKTDQALSEHFADARVDGHDAIAAECLRISDTPVEGVETVTKADGAVEERRGDMLGHRKLQIDTRLKLLAKWDPRRYGDSVQVKHADADGDKLPEMDPTATAAKIAALLAAGQARKDEAGDD